MSLLEVRSVGMRFGGLTAVDDFNLTLEKGELVGLIGPNGAGKTTVFNSISGVYQPTSGETFVDGVSAKGKKPSKLSALGLTRTFQNIRLFKNLTVEQNVMIGATQNSPYGMGAAFFRTPGFFAGEDAFRKNAFDLLSIFGLEGKAEHEASSLSYGEQRKLEIVRALATKPKVVLLDEPAAGMNRRETENLMSLIAQIRKEFSLSVLLIEHDMKLVMGICERILVLDHGVTIAQGKPDEIRKNPKVISAYLGVDAEAEALA